MSNIQALQVEGLIETLASQHGARYVNRHFPEQVSFGFMQEQLRAFAAALITENESDRAAAKRYRWLKEKDMLFSWEDKGQRPFTSIRAIGTVTVQGKYGRDVDAAIDALIAIPVRRGARNSAKDDHD